jgi:hypothetical protein
MTEEVQIAVLDRLIEIAGSALHNPYVMLIESAL